MSKFRYQKEFIFCDRKPDEVKRFLKDKPNTDLTQIFDDKNNTALHQAAYQESLEVLRQYINHMWNYYKNNLHLLGKQRQHKQMTDLDIKYRLVHWANAKNNEGFTALHYAAFKGQIQILDYLNELGADFNIKTKSGLGILHLASQTDKVKTFVYYRDKIEISDLDDRKSTPLHWAAFSDSQKVTEYLLGRRSRDLADKIKREGRNFMISQQFKKTDWINAKDVEGQTALHLATANGNTKIVRQLLIAGAERHIKNNQSLQPIRIARQNEFLNIEKFLNDNYTWTDYVKFFFNIKIKYEPKIRSCTMPIIFLALSILLTVTLTYALKYEEEYTNVFYIQSGIFLLLILDYFSLIVQSPKNNKGNYDKLERIWLKKQRIFQESLDLTVINSSSYSRFGTSPLSENDICYRCVQYKNPRSNHCHICNTCTEQFDHHCPWINNCVGKHNITRFVFFIVLLFIAMNWLCSIAVQLILILINAEHTYQLFFTIRDQFKSIPILKQMFIGVILLLWIIFVIPLFSLIVVQIGNLFLGKTTFERFTKSNKQVLSKSQQSFMAQTIGPQNSNKNTLSCKNCFKMCYSQPQDQRLLLN